MKETSDSFYKLHIKYGYYCPYLFPPPSTLKLHTKYHISGSHSVQQMGCPLRLARQSHEVVATRVEQRSQHRKQTESPAFSLLFPSVEFSFNNTMQNLMSKLKLLLRGFLMVLHSRYDNHEYRYGTHIFCIRIA